MAVTIELDADCVIQTGRIPDALIPDDASFESLWGLHPEEFSELKIHGKTVKMPRWDRAYAKDCLLYTSPSPRDRTRSRMPSSA